MTKPAEPEFFRLLGKVLDAGVSIPGIERIAVPGYPLFTFFSEAMTNELQNESDFWFVRLKKIGAAFAVWTILGLSFAFRSYGWSIQSGVDFPLWGYISQTLTDFYLYALASPLVFRLGRRFPLEFGRLTTSISVHLAASLLFTALTIVISVFAVQFLGLSVCQDCPKTEEILQVYLTSPIIIHQGLLAYWGMVFVGQGLKYYREVRSEKERVARLSAQLAEAQLSALKMQIHPHFLFNTLNSIAALVQQDSDAAELMISKLSNFLRMTLHSSGSPVVTLSEEFNFLKTYLDIEKVRYQERLSIEFVADEAVLDAKIPNLLLQPLVENSIRHGISQRKENGFIKISARRIGDNRLHIEIADNGKVWQNKLHSQSNNGGGVGLKNTVERLKQIYGDGFNFKIGGNEADGTTVEIKIPLEK